MPLAYDEPWPNRTPGSCAQSGSGSRAMFCRLNAGPGLSSGRRSQNLPSWRADALRRGQAGNGGESRATLAGGLGGPIAVDSGGARLAERQVEAAREERERERDAAQLAKQEERDRRWEAGRAQREADRSACEIEAKRSSARRLLVSEARRPRLPRWLVRRQAGASGRSGGVGGEITGQAAEWDARDPDRKLGKDRSGHRSPIERQREFCPSCEARIGVDGRCRC